MSSLATTSLRDALADVQSADAVNVAFIQRIEVPNPAGSVAGTRKTWRYPVHRVPMLREVAEEFQGVLAGTIAELVAKLGGDGGEATRRLVPFDPFSESEEPRQEVIAIADVPVLASLVAEIRDGQEGQLEAIGRIDDAFLDSLWGYAVVASRGGRRTLYFRKFLPSRVIRVAGLLKFMWRQGFRKIEEPVFNFDENVDAVVVGGDALIIQKTLFEQLFDLVGKFYSPRAQEAIEKLREAAILDDVDRLSEACATDDNKVKKLAEIRQGIDFSRLTWSNLKKIQEDYGVGVELDDQKQQILFQPSAVWPLLKLLADDFLRSDLTGARYEVQSKRKVEKQKRERTVGGRRPKSSRARGSSPEAQAPTETGRP
jgi:hypothetical protein